MEPKRYPQLATIDRCTGCLVCVDVCPQQALAKTVNEEGHLTYTLNHDLCIHCLKCEKTCPVVSDMDYGDNSLSNPVFAAWSNDATLRKRSSSGGVATAVARHILEKGVVIGANMEGVTCKHTVIDNIKDLPKLQGSKYMQSDASGSYRAALKYLREGRKVLYIGLPCQVAAILCMTSGGKFKDSLYTMDMACGGVPSLLLRDKFIKSSGYDVVAIASFRNKDKGWRSVGYRYELKTTNHNGETMPIPARNLLLGGFGMGLTNRHSCYACRFALVNRKSDFTVADFWGDTDFPEQHYDGLSTLSIHTTKGKAMVEELCKRNEIGIGETTWEKVLNGNYRYAYGKSPIGKSFQRKHLSWLFKHCSYKTLCQLYAGNVKVYNPLFVVKAILRMVNDCNKKYGLKYINHNILNR